MRAFDRREQQDERREKITMRKDCKAYQKRESRGSEEHDQKDRLVEEAKRSSPRETCCQNVDHSNHPG